MDKLLKMMILIFTFIYVFILIWNNFKIFYKKYKQTKNNSLIKIGENNTDRKKNLIHYQNKLSDWDINTLNSYLIDNGSMINYHKSKIMIDRIMKKYFPEYYWEKMRISCKSSNKIDASKLHRDVISNNLHITNNIFYTIIIYLEDSVFGYIPYSNYTYNIENEEKSLNVSKYDIIMFDSTTLHRGIFTNKNIDKKRTCIQIFNVVHKKNIDYCKHIKNTVLSNNRLEKLIYSPFLHKFDRSLIFNPYSNGTNCLLLMIEGGSSRTTKNIDKENLYYMNPEFPRIIKTIKNNFSKLYRFL